MSVLLYLYEVITDRHVNYVVSFIVSHHGLAVLRSQDAIYIYVCTCHGDGCVFVIHMSIHGERTDILEVESRVNE